MRIIGLVERLRCRRVGDYDLRSKCNRRLRAKADGTPVDPKTWTGFGWGLGIAADFDLGGKRVTGATVRVTDISGNVGVGFVLEAHYFFAEWSTGQRAPYYSKAANYNCNNIAIGPYVAVEIGGGSSATTDPRTDYGRVSGNDGWIPSPNAPSTSSWNFGIGLRVDPKAKVLGDGVVANQAPPPGITTADQLLKTEPRYGIMLPSSFSF